MTVRILVGDALEHLRRLPSDSVHCVVTSPPYWGLRDYGVDGQMGLEPTLGQHLDAMVSLFREVRRVLRADGTCWVNYGDCYATSPNGRSAAATKAAGTDNRTFRDKPFSTIDPSIGLKPKDLCMIPNRLAIALQEDGWWVRSEIIWAKPNPMPETVRDRPAQAHEKVFLLTRSARYWYDVEAVKEPVTGGAHPRRKDGQRPADAGADPFDHRPGSWVDRYQPDTRHLRNVWTIPIYGFPEAHFATFPPDLAEICIKAGCPSDGIVLDPFGGAGTTGLVADRLGRDAILIELNPKYAAMARERIARDGGMLTEVLVA